MCWVKHTIASSMLAAIGMAITAQPAMAGVVVSSSGPSSAQYPVGKNIADSDRIVLRAGDSLSVLDGRGTRVLRGAGTYTLGRASARTNNRTFASLTAQRSATRARTGAVRTGDVDIRKPNLWYVDVTKSGTICLPGAEQIRLWRAETSTQSDFRLSNAVNDPASSTVTFQKDEMLAIWSESMPATEGVNYVITSADGTGSANISFRFFGDTPDNPEGLAALLIEQGCMDQLEEMSSALILADS